MKKREDCVEGKDYLILEEGAILWAESLPPLAPKAIEIVYKRRCPQPTPPTYEQVAAGGVTLVHKHDESTVETEEEKRALAAYQEEMRQWNAGLSENLMNLFLGEGTRLELSEERRADWNYRLKMYGVIESEDDLPENELERKLLYLNVLGIKSRKFVQNVSTMVMRQTGVEEADLEAAEALF